MEIVRHQFDSICRKVLRDEIRKLYGPFAAQDKGIFAIENEERVPIHFKMTLTIKEAAEYSNVGINKIDALLKQSNCPFVLNVGIRKLVKHREFEEHIRREISI